MLGASNDPMIQGSNDPMIRGLGPPRSWRPPAEGCVNRARARGGGGGGATWWARLSPQGPLGMGTLLLLGLLGPMTSRRCYCYCCF